MNSKDSDSGSSLLLLYFPFLSLCLAVLKDTSFDRFRSEFLASLNDTPYLPQEDSPATGPSAPPHPPAPARTTSSSSNQPQNEIGGLPINQVETGGSNPTAEVPNLTINTTTTTTTSSGGKEKGKEREKVTSTGNSAGHSVPGSPINK